MPIKYLKNYIGSEMIQLELIGRPQDAVDSIEKSIKERVTEKYSDVTPEFLVLERKRLMNEAEELDNKILAFNVKSKKITSQREDMHKKWNDFVQQLDSIFTESKIDITNVDFPISTSGRTFIEKLATLHIDNIRLENQRIPLCLDESKLADMIEEKYELDLSLQVIKIEIAKKAELYREMQEISQEVA